MSVSLTKRRTKSFFRMGQLISVNIWEAEERQLRMASLSYSICTCLSWIF
jgi:hypothetical protein